MTVNEIVLEATKNINPEWSCLEKIRYIYIEVGKYLVKDTDFFFSAEGKLAEANLSVEQMTEIYNNLNGRDGRIICRSACYILQKALAEVGISSEMIKSNNNVAHVGNLEIAHWFLSVNNYETNENYFMTLSTDLPYVKNNLKTKHFGSNIPYIKELPDGSKVQVYEGKEIKNTVLLDDVLYEIDKNIGYISHYYFDRNKSNDNAWTLSYEDAGIEMVNYANRGNNLYYELLGYETDFYKELTEFKGNDGKRILFSDISIHDISKDDWKIWIKQLCKLVSEKLNDIIGFPILQTNFDDSWNYEDWIRNVVFKTQELIFLQINSGLSSPNFSEYYIKDDMKYSKWSRDIKKKFDVKNNHYETDSILAILDKTNALVNNINSGFKNGKFNDLFKSLMYHYIPSENILENNIDNDGYLSNSFIANKLNVVFRKVFSCEEEKSDFNDMKYSEQIVIIKELISAMFPEINQNNSSQMENYDERFSPVFNRIQLYPIKNRKTGYYDIVINVVGTNSDLDYYFFYNPKKNIFKPVSVLTLMTDYIIVSERFKSKMSEMEEIDTNNFGGEEFKM